MSEFSERIANLSPKRLALLALELQSKLESMEKWRQEPIAVIGIGCRFPGGADGPEGFWRLLSDGVDAITEVPPDRWDLARYYDPDPDAPGKMNTRHGGFLAGVDRFDPHFFDISPREALSMDPQQRLLLEVAGKLWNTPRNRRRNWRAVAPACSSASATRTTASAAGAGAGIPSTRTWPPAARMRSRPGASSYVLGLHGPSVSIDTACSSSLVAVHLACQSLRAREMPHGARGRRQFDSFARHDHLLSKARMLAADGRCKTFDASADGYVRGEGCGIVVLKRLSDALGRRRSHPGA